jgi:hypothetical protein
VANEPKPFRTVLLHGINEKPLETVQGMKMNFNHRAEATVLMRSLRATPHSLNCWPAGTTTNQEFQNAGIKKPNAQRFC